MSGVEPTPCFSNFLISIVFVFAYLCRVFACNTPKDVFPVSAFECSFDDDDDDSGGRKQRGC